MQTATALNFVLHLNAWWKAKVAAEIAAEIDPNSYLVAESNRMI
jgi:hypothetical protein